MKNRTGSFFLLGLLLLGCSVEQRDTVDEAVSYGTGKTQVQQFQRMQQQVRDIQRDHTEQFPE